MQQNLDFQKFEKESGNDTFEENKPAKKPKPNLSQSLLKAYVDYYDENVKGCGLQIRKQYFEKLPTPSSEAAKLGIYFEYKATDYVREGDPIPQPKMVYAGTAKEKFAVDYERAADSALLFKDIVKKHNIEILKVGEYMTHDGCSGISDIRAKWKGEECIIDLKYSALIEDKWNEYGWHTESLVYKSKQLLQPIHYKYLVKKTMGIEDIPFYYFIFSSKDPKKAKIIKTNIQPEHIQLHEEVFVPKMKSYIDFHYNNPEKLEARPNYIRCLECPFYDNCDKRAEVPLIEQIDY
jgi:hypothetical protein